MEVIKKIGCMALVFVCSAGITARAGKPAKRATLPQSEIYRPLLLPKGMMQFRPGFGLQATVNDSEVVVDPDWSSLVGLLPRWSITDRIEFPHFPFPLFLKCLISARDIVARGDSVLSSFAATFSGGLLGAAYSPGNGIQASLAVALHCKRIASKRNWWESALETTFYSHGLMAARFAAISGFQLINTLSVSIGAAFIGNTYNVMEGNYRHPNRYNLNVPVAVEWHIKKWVSLSAHASPGMTFNYMENWYSIPVQAAIIAQW